MKDAQSACELAYERISPLFSDLSSTEQTQVIARLTQEMKNLGQITQSQETGLNQLVSALVSSPQS